MNQFSLSTSGSINMFSTISSILDNLGFAASITSTYRRYQTTPKDDVLIHELLFLSDEFAQQRVKLQSVERTGREESDSMTRCLNDRV
jgi:hypothetical protein